MVLPKSPRSVESRPPKDNAERLTSPRRKKGAESIGSSTISSHTHTHATTERASTRNPTDDKSSKKSSSSPQNASSRQSRSSRSGEKSNYSAARQIVSALNSAISREERLQAITAAHKEFDHHKETLHESELREGAANALYQKLCLSLVQDGEDTDEEVRLICETLEMIYRVSETTRDAQFSTFSKFLFPILLRILEIYEGKSDADGDRIVLSTLKFLYYFSQAGQSAKLMVKQGELLSIFTRVILSDRIDVIRASTMFTLSELACDDKSTEVIVYHPNMLHAILQAASLDLVAEMREVAARVILNICSHVATLPDEPLSDLFDVLVRLSRDCGKKTKRYVAGSLERLSSTEQNCRFLVRFRGGDVLLALLDLMDSEESTVTRLWAVTATLSLVREDTAEIIMEKDVVKSLAHVCVDDPNEEVRKKGEEALTRFANYINHPMPCHEELLTALVFVGLRRHEKDTMIASAFMQQSLNVDNREVMANHDGLLNFLYEAANPKSDRSIDVKEDALLALSYIARR